MFTIIVNNYTLVTHIETNTFCSSTGLWGGFDSRLSWSFSIVSCWRGSNCQRWFSQVILTVRSYSVNNRWCLMLIFNTKEGCKETEVSGNIQISRFLCVRSSFNCLRFCLSYEYSSLVAQMVENLSYWKPGFNPWLRKIPWRREWLPTTGFLPGESHGQRSLASYNLWLSLI